MRMASHDGVLAGSPGQGLEVRLGSRAQASPGLRAKRGDLVTTFRRVMSDLLSVGFQRGRRIERGAGAEVAGGGWVSNSYVYHSVRDEVRTPGNNVEYARRSAMALEVWDRYLSEGYCACGFRRICQNVGDRVMPGDGPWAHRAAHGVVTKRVKLAPALLGLARNVLALLDNSG